MKRKNVLKKCFILQNVFISNYDLFQQLKARKNRGNVKGRQTKVTPERRKNAKDPMAQQMPPGPPGMYPSPDSNPGVPSPINSSPGGLQSPIRPGPGHMMPGTPGGNEH